MEIMRQLLKLLYWHCAIGPSEQPSTVHNVTQIELVVLRFCFLTCTTYLNLCCAKMGKGAGRDQDDCGKGRKEVK